jgi:hypothetical protein
MNRIKASMPSTIWSIFEDMTQEATKRPTATNVVKRLDAFDSSMQQHLKDLYTAEAARDILH